MTTPQQEDSCSIQDSFLVEKESDSPSEIFADVFSIATDADSSEAIWL
jgi:hypothetical protein